MDKLIERAKAENRNLLEPECLELLERYGIVPPRHSVVDTAGEAVAAAGKIGYPVALKIVSRDILHKSDVGGVKVGLADESALRHAFEEIGTNVAKHAPGAKIEGMLLVESVRKGVECIIGMTRDAQLGTALVFGLGGTMVEVLEDVSICLLPIKREEAENMVRSIKGFKLLNGYRGSEPCDIDAIADMIVAVGRLVEQNPEIRELDINPLFAYPNGAMPVDARILV